MTESLLKENNKSCKSVDTETDQATPEWMVGSLTIDLNAGDPTTLVRPDTKNSVSFY